MRLLILAVLPMLALSIRFTDFPKPSFTNTRSCGMLPNRPPRVFMHPPQPEDACDLVECPHAPNQCYYDSACVGGQCLAPQPKPAGSSCSDEDPTTVGDTCDGNGKCVGSSIQCPADIQLKPQSQVSSTAVFWRFPRVHFKADTYTLTSTHSPGDRFSVGTTEVVYTASGTTAGGDVTIECRFHVVIKGECDDECCSRHDGRYSRPQPRLRLDFAPSLSRFESMFQPSQEITCQGGLSICEQPRSFLPNRPPMAPPLPPKFFQTPAGEAAPTTSSASTTQAPTTQAPTTQAPTTQAPTTQAPTTQAPSSSTSGVSGSDIPCSERKVDVVFVLDASGSVTEPNFQIAQSFVNDVVGELNVRADVARVAGVMFHAEVLVDQSFDFDDATNIASVQNRISSFDYPTDALYGTATGRALDYVTNNVLVSQAGHRADTDTIVVLLTDGRSLEAESTVEQAAQNLRATGAEVLAIGITSMIDQNQLEVIAGSTDNVLEVPTFADLDSVSDTFIAKICQAGRRRRSLLSERSMAKEAPISQESSNNSVFHVAVLGLGLVIAVVGLMAVVVVSKGKQSQLPTHIQVTNFKADSERTFVPVPELVVKN